MLKLRTVGAALGVLFALCAVIASSAFAVEPLWLIDGNAVLNAERSESESEILVIIYAKPEELTKVLTELLCSGIFVGTVGPKGEDEVIQVLTLAESVIGEDGASLVGEPLLCDVTDGGSLESCEAGVGKAEVWPANLPWHTQLELVGTELIDKFPANAGYEMRCKTLIGIIVENLCTDEPLVLVSNDPGGSVLTFLDPVADNKLGNCSLTGEHTLEFISEKDANGNPLSGDIRADPHELEWLTLAIDD
jgi:hypothetical protein